MIHTLKINGYRGFKDFTMGGLGRINLLVGTNNSGKTSVLEALQFLAAEGEPGTLWRILGRRGEHLLDNPVPGQMMQILQPELDVCHLFHNHELRAGTFFSINAKNKTIHRSITYKVDEAKQESLAFFPPDGDPAGTRLALYIEGTPAPAPTIAMIPLTRRDGVRFDTYDVLSRMPKGQKFDALNYKFIGAESLPIGDLVGLWSGIALTPAEERTVEALKVLEPKIERIANTNTIIQALPIGHVARGGFKVKLRGVKNPVPIGSLGDGIWRMLALAMTLSQAKDGLLLIDEIDSGLHYSVMEDMWKLVAKTAKDLNVQVFATTHSYDCVKSLAAICHKDSDTNEQVSIQRIEPERGQAVVYTEAEIKTAAKRHIEVR